MLKINKNYKKIQKNYIFSLISQKKNDYLKNNPKQKILNLGIGDVTKPLSDNLINLLSQTLKYQNQDETFKGYPPETGYEFLKSAVCDYYKTKNVYLAPDEVFVSNGIGCDVTNILNLFSGATAVIQNPTYPAYFDSNFLSGNKIILLNATKQNNFKMLPTNLKRKNYLIYLCSPNNPTGATLTKNDLTNWVQFANTTKSVIIFDSAYERFIEDQCPSSIFEIDGAENCAIEMGSFSKTAGFTNLRCSYTIIKKQLVIQNQNLNQMWQRRQSTYFNGVPYFIQMGAKYALSEDGLKECDEKISYYKQNAKILKNALLDMGFKVADTDNSPYVWFECPNGYSSWEFFDYLLNNFQIVGIPGVGFGTAGEGYFRLSGFSRKEDILEAITRLKNFKV